MRCFTRALTVPVRFYLEGKREVGLDLDLARMPIGDEFKRGLGMTEEKMATVRAVSKLAGPGQGICKVRGQQYRLDAPPLIEGPNKEVNPVEAMIASLAACAVLFLQHLARTMDIPIEDVTAEIEADFDPRGVRGEDVDSALAAVRLTYRIRPGVGADRLGIDKLVEAFRARCPVHRTFAKAVDIAEEVLLG